MGENKAKKPIMKNIIHNELIYRGFSVDVGIAEMSIFVFPLKPDSLALYFHRVHL